VLGAAHCRRLKASRRCWDDVAGWIQVAWHLWMVLKAIFSAAVCGLSTLLSAFTAPCSAWAQASKPPAIPTALCHLGHLSSSTQSCLALQAAYEDASGPVPPQVSAGCLADCWLWACRGHR
jgi:hypothetical protein